MGRATMIAQRGTMADDRPAGRDDTSGLWWRQYRWIVFRLLYAVLILFLVSVLIFAATVFLPGDVAQMILGRTATPERVAALRAELGLDRPPLVQYLEWIGGLFRGDLGVSLVSQRSIAEMVGPPVANTLILLGCTAVIGLPIAIVVGIISAVRPGGLVDGLVNIASVVIAALPEFVIGVLLILLFAIGVLQWFPAVSVLPGSMSPLQRPEVLVLPVATLVLVVQPYLTRQVRASLYEALGSEYVVMAAMKGLSRRVILTRHALRNGITPAIQAGAFTLSYLLGGTIIIEYLFQYPGIGMALIQAVEQRDIPVVQVVVLVLALGYVVFNLAADVLNVLVTPKLRRP